jgi:ABC-2 type transport system ATP-binding protein
MDNAAIRLIDVSKSYGDVMALNHVSFAVPRAQICGFLGPNGAGKTTTIRILFDLIRPSAGRAEILGFDCQEEGVKARTHMGYLPGDLRLYENQTAEQMFLLLAGLRGESAVPHYARDLCDRLMLDSRQRIGSLSKGNKQKVGLVLALMHRPPVLVLDEPTSGLDPLVQEEVERILFELADAGHTVFFSSHVLSEVERMCHRVVIIRGGQVVAEEDVADLKERSLHILEVTFANHVPDGAFRLPGVEELRRDGKVVHLQVRSNLDGALKAIARFPVRDIRTEQPSLEDVFLAFYKDQTSEVTRGAEPANV